MEPTPLFSYPSTSTPEAKLKNCFALIILLAGLFVGSLFLDVAQLLSGSGFSGTALREQNVLETAGKTWVAYTEPAIQVKVVSDDTCIDCAPDEALLWMRRIMPTLNAEKVAYDSFEGKTLITTHALKSLPAFIFDSNVTTTDFYLEAAPLFHQSGQEYFFDMHKIGLPVGKYLSEPSYTDGDIRLGNAGSPVSVTIFTDFACEYCKDYHTTYKQLIEEYGERVAFVMKHFPLPTHPEAEAAALAASCASEQDLFLPYADILFERQAEWTTGNQTLTRLKNYAWRVKGMNGRDLATCIDEKRFSGIVESNRTMASEFNLQAAPATFVGSDFISGAAPKEEIQKLIEGKLGQEN